jgi:hypothetical protein
MVWLMCKVSNLTANETLGTFNKVMSFLLLPMGIR